MISDQLSEVTVQLYNDELDEKTHHDIRISVHSSFWQLTHSWQNWHQRI